MAHQWKAGDLAVCVMPGQVWDKSASGAPAPANAPSHGKVYRFVEAVMSSRPWWQFWNMPILLLGFENVPGRYNAACFRPILPADPAFTEAMRSLKLKVRA
tara:strand:+ start:38679 stop:38981 length:303 start_codon:yes stop_codon:yes gene_type:complete